MRTWWLALLVLGMAGCQTLLAPVPQFSDVDRSDALDLAARCLDNGDDAGAVPHLEAVVVAHPDQVMFRAQLAELLYRLERGEEARHHFEQFISAAQEATGAPYRHLVHCHTRLMELAQRDENPGEASFQRGVGLLLLASQTNDMSSRSDEGFEESVLSRAVKALSDANEETPNDPRVLLYLGEAYAKIGSRQAAERAWKAARLAAVPGLLTRTEQRRLTELTLAK